MKGKSTSSLWRHALSLTFAVGVVCAFFFFSVSRLQYQWHWAGIWEYRSLLIHGWLVTMLISVLSLFVSLFFGFTAALARRSAILPLRYLSLLYIEIIRGTPLLVQLLIFFYIVGDAFGIQDRVVAGVLILSFFSGAYLAEIFRAGIESVGETQLETARAVGFTPFQTYRFVIIPQVLTRSLPPLAGQLASLIKDSSLLSVISVTEFTFSAQTINARTYSTLEAYIPLAIGYLILTLPISWLSRWLERRYSYET